MFLINKIFEIEIEIKNIKLFGKPVTTKHFCDMGIWHETNLPHVLRYSLDTCNALYSTYIWSHRIE